MKERLRRYAKLFSEIDIIERRLDAITGDSGFFYRRLRNDISERLRRLRDDEAAEYEALTGMIDELPCSEQRQVIMTRYFDGKTWAEVSEVIFGRRPDFDEKAESYQRRVYRIHGDALANLNRIAGQ